MTEEFICDKVIERRPLVPSIFPPPYQGRVQLFILGVEVWRKPNSGFGPPVDQDFPLEELAAHLLRVRHIDGDGATTLIGIARSVYLPSPLVGEFDEPCGLPA